MEKKPLYQKRKFLKEVLLPFMLFLVYTIPLFSLYVLVKVNTFDMLVRMVAILGLALSVILVKILRTKFSIHDITYVLGLYGLILSVYCILLNTNNYRLSIYTIVTLISMSLLVLFYFIKFSLPDILCTIIPIGLNLVILIMTVIMLFVNINPNEVLSYAFLVINYKLCVEDYFKYGFKDVLQSNKK